MLDVAIMGRDPFWIEILEEICDESGAVRDCDVRVYDSPVKLDSWNPLNGVILLPTTAQHAVGEIESLAAHDSNAVFRTIITLTDCDDALLALDLIGLGVPYVVTGVPTILNDCEESACSSLEAMKDSLHPTLTEFEASGEGRPISERILPIELAPDDGVFVSMKYDKRRNSAVEHDYAQAIRPALKRLGVRVRLSRELRVGSGEDINAKIRREIASSRVLLFQGSALSDYVAYELGIADSLIDSETSQLEQLIMVRHVSEIDKSSLLRNRETLTYLSRTDLALKLFFGLRTSSKVQPK